MKLVLLAALLALSPAALAASPRASCIDPHRSYVARPLNRHDVYVEASIGKPKPPVRLKTSCAFLEPAIAVSFSSSFTCVGQGDTVVATTTDGRRETCIVTGVLPYAPMEGDLKR